MEDDLQKDGGGPGDSEIISMKISDIKIEEKRRQPKQEIIDELAQSIEAIGLINPITVSKDGTLISGLHRIRAFEKLRREEIPARIVDLEGQRRELAEGDENIVRQDIPLLERAEYLLWKKKIYEEMHPDTKQGGKRTKQSEDSGPNKASRPRFTETIAKVIGDSERSVQRWIQIAEKIPLDVKAKIRETPVASSLKDLTLLSTLSESDQVRVAEIIVQNPELTVKEACDQLKLGGDNITQSPTNNEVTANQQPASTETTPATKKKRTRQSAPTTAGSQEKTGSKPPNRTVIQEVIAAASRDTGKQFVVLVPDDSETVLEELPNVYLGKVADITFEQTATENGPSGGLFLKLKLSNDPEAYPKAPITLIDGHLTFNTNQLASDVEEDPKQKVFESAEDPKIKQTEGNMNQVEVTGDTIVRCDCGHEIAIPASNLKWNAEEIFQREMGPERCHVSKGQWKCGGCEHDVEVEVTVWEYPTGTISNAEVKVQGGTLEKEPQFEIKQEMGE